MVVAVTVSGGGGVTRMTMKVNHPTPCHKWICMDSILLKKRVIASSAPKNGQICYKKMWK
jgi:hypothetical protein